MNIRLIDENTYERLDDNGVQVGQVGVTQEMRDGARTKHMKLETYIRKVVEKVTTEAPLAAVPVEGETVVVVPPHEHDLDERYALSEHEHDYAPAVHYHDHTHDEFLVLKDALEEESRVRFKADQQAEAKYSSHMHPELAQAFHTHADIIELLNVLNNRVTSVAATIPTETQPHQHNDILQALETIRSEVTSIRNQVTGAENRAEENIRRAEDKLRLEMQDIQPKGDYAMKADLDALTKRKAEWVELSRQTVDGKLRIVLEEA